MKTVPLTVRIPADVEKRLGRLAESTARSKSFLAAEAIEEYLALQEWQVAAILEGKRAAEREQGTDLETVKKAWEARLERPTD